MEEGTLALCIQPHKISNSLDTLIVTMEKEHDKKNTSSYTFNFGRGVVAWASKKQPNVMLGKSLGSQPRSQVGVFPRKSVALEICKMCVHQKVISCPTYFGGS